VPVRSPPVVDAGIERMMSVTRGELFAATRK
jgi:hypothetical protein